MNQVPYPPIQPQTTVVQVAQPQIPPEYRPIGAWAYFGWQLLFSLPLVGFIMLCVFALGGTSNINLKNFARSYFCVYLLLAVLAIIGLLILLISGVGLAGLTGLFMNESIRY